MTDGSRNGRRTGGALLSVALASVILAGVLASSTALTPTAAASEGGNVEAVENCQELASAGTHYRVATDLAENDGPCLRITASNVTVEGDSHDVSGGNGSGAIAVVANGSAVSGVRVRNVTVADSRAGVRIGATDGPAVGVTAESITAVNNSRAGVISFASDLTLNDSVLEGNAVGVEVIEGNVTMDGVVVNDSDGTGLKTAIDVSEVLITDSRFLDNGGRGLLLRSVDPGGLALANVTASRNGIDGIEVEQSAPGATLSGVVAANNSRHGVVVRSGGTSVTDSELSDNADAGARLAGSNTTATGLTATGNADGIDLSGATGVAVRDTDANGNERGIVLSNTAGSTVEETTFSDNTGVGLLVNESTDNTLTDLTARNDGRTVRLVGDGRVNVSRLTLSNGTVSFTASEVEFDEVGSPGPARPGSRAFGPYLNVSTTGDDGDSLLPGEEGGEFLDLTVHYRPSDLEEPPLDDSTVRIGRYDDGWSTVGNGSRDTAERRVSANITAPGGVYAPVAALRNAVTECGRTLDGDGRTYRVDTDLSGSGSRCLLVDGSDITVIGFGQDGEQPRSLDGQDAGSSGIVVADGAAGTTLRNLTVRDFGTGFELRGDDTTIRRATAFSNADRGLLVTGTGTAVRNVSAGSNGGADGDGILLRGATDTSLEQVLVRNSGGWGLREAGSTSGTTATELNVFYDEDDDGVGRNVVVAFDASRHIALGPVADPPDRGRGLEGIGDYLDIEGQQDDAYLDLTIAYDEGDVSDESALSFYRYDDRTGTYSEVTDPRVDPAADTVGANLTSFSTFAPLVDTSTDGGSGGGDDGGGDSGDDGGDDGDSGGDGGDRDSGDDGGDGGDDSGDGGDDEGNDSGDEGTDDGDSGDDGDEGTDDGDGGGGSDDGDESEPGVGAGTGDTDDGGSDSGSSSGGGGGGGGGGAAAQGSPTFVTTAASLDRSSMAVGGTVLVNATVSNEGDGVGTYEVELFRDGRFVQSRLVELVPGETEAITFERSPDEAGTYGFRVENVTAGTVNVTTTDGGSISTATPAATPDGTSADGAGDGSGEGGSDDGSAGGSSSDQGGSGADEGSGDSNEVIAPGTAGGSDTELAGFEPLGVMAGGVGALAVGAGAIYLLVLRP